MMTACPHRRVAAFRDFIQSADFPCVGAKSALVRDALEIVAVGRIDSAQSDLDIRAALRAFSANLDRTGPIVQSLAVVFDGPTDMSELRFERELWERLQSLHNLDVVAGETWATGIERDPESAHFAYSAGGEPFFVVGLHPKASRPARRFEFPVMVFNSHEQFERLKADGRYDRMQSIIREREMALCGSINPMLRDHGMGAAAAQYSGRQVGENWSCPFDVKVDGRADVRADAKVETKEPEAA